MQSRKLVLALVCLGLVLTLPGLASAAQKTSSLVTALTAPVPAGTLNGSPFPGGTFAGTLTISQFQAANGVLSAIGSLTGAITSTTGAVTNVSQAVTVPVAVNGSCPILNLTLGPLDLNLLGLTVHLNQVVLNITAVPGAGNLLGNLLCDVANLLNGGGPIQNLLTSLASLLNQILAALP